MTLRLHPQLRGVPAHLHTVHQRGPATDGGGHVNGPDVDYASDASRIVVTAEEPFPVQVDGDAIGSRTSLEVEWMPDALRVLSEPPE